MNRRQVLWRGAAVAGLLLAGSAAYRSFAADIAASRARIGTGSTLFESSFGTMEFAVTGSGPPVIMIHGTGGGFDQGLFFARLLIDKGYQIVAPSRFGYLRTAMPDDPSSEHQADAIIDLMNHLGLDRAAIIGGSAGALSAIQVAIRHPARCSALIAIVPATYVPGREPVRPGVLGAAIMTYALQSDFLFWAGMTMAENTMINTLLATDIALVNNATAAEKARVRQILRDILPVSARAKGLLNDARLAGTPAPMELSAIKAPTLAISLEDDRFGTYEAARHIAGSVNDAKLVSFPTGGHVFVGREVALFDAVEPFLAQTRAKQ